MYERMGSQMTRRNDGKPHQNYEEAFQIASRLNREQLQSDYEAAGSLARLGEMHGLNGARARQLLVAAGIEIQKRGCNGSDHPPAWYEAQRRWREDRADEWRAAQDKGRENRWKDPAARESIRQMMIARYEDPAEREKQAEIARRLWDDPDRPLYHWDRDGQRELAKQNMLRLLANTPLYPYELIVAAYLDEIGVDYIPHCIEPGRELDLYVESCNVDIEIDGLGHYTQPGRVRDAERDVELTEKGYRIHRIPHATVDDDSYVPALRHALGLK